MLSRQDAENLYLMYSDGLHFWHTKTPLLKPTYSWEFLQIGNCGSPIETEAGWLVISHGVGPMRKYSIGAFLLDLEDPSRVIGRLPHPLLSPDESEREGYVPNVVYSCGSLIHAGRLICRMPCPTQPALLPRYRFPICSKPWNPFPNEHGCTNPSLWR
jgi:predicted GH43/DUF377 family glycosyl hydrolase